MTDSRAMGYLERFTDACQPMLDLTIDRASTRQKSPLAVDFANCLTRDIYVLRRLLDGIKQSELASEVEFSRQRIHQIKAAAIAAGFTIPNTGES